ncbi:MAG: hypothetical protein IKR48_08775 [Kiritimatiellae bacterium]|nr:hypothetical protein [Kiritimatiellia bacterium]
MKTNFDKTLRQGSVVTHLAIALALVFFCGCSTVSHLTMPASNPGNLPPLKVGVYADNGPSGIGAVEWFRLINGSPEMELHLLDGEAIRNGKLDGLDVLVMPGGSSADEYRTLRPEGVEKMKAFFRAGGGYIGTCAGCSLMTDDVKGRACVMPWKRVASEPATMFPTFNLNEKGAAALGLKAGSHVFRYHGGPFLEPSTNVIADAKIEVWGTIDAEATMKGKVKTEKKMYGSPAILGGTFGKGKMFITSGHPEYFNGTIYIVVAAFKYVTGRDITFPARPRNPRSIAVGFLASGIQGVETAATALDIDAEKDFDLVPIDMDGMRQRRLDHLDVLVLASKAPLKNKPMQGFIREFVARGGKVVGFNAGIKALPPGGIACEPRKGTVEAIRKFFPQIQPGS